MEDNNMTAQSWAAQPEMSDEAIKASTGKGWNEWRSLIDASPQPLDGHPAIANYVRASHDLTEWWVQAVTGGYERISGLRLLNQMPDGTFTANKSKTLTLDPENLRSQLLSDPDRASLFPGISTELRSKPTAKALRVGIDPGIANIALDKLSDGRTRVTVQHAGLPTSADVNHWKSFWGRWLMDLEQQELL